LINRGEVVVHAGHGVLGTGGGLGTGVIHD
jgi:hypothetical protein